MFEKNFKVLYISYSKLHEFLEYDMNKIIGYMFLKCVLYDLWLSVILDSGPIEQLIDFTMMRFYVFELVYVILGKRFEQTFYSKWCIGHFSISSLAKLIKMKMYATTIFDKIDLVVFQRGIIVASCNFKSIFIFSSYYTWWQFLTILNSFELCIDII